jgi:hypothetical protein
MPVGGTSPRNCALLLVLPDDSIAWDSAFKREGYRGCTIPIRHKVTQAPKRPPKSSLRAYFGLSSCRIRLGISKIVEVPSLLLDVVAESGSHGWGNCIRIGAGGRYTIAVVLVLLFSSQQSLRSASSCARSSSDSDPSCCCAWPIIMSSSISFGVDCGRSRPER